jgi:hypothetical protein
MYLWLYIVANFNLARARSSCASVGSLLVLTNCPVSLSALLSPTLALTWACTHQERGFSELDYGFLDDRGSVGIEEVCV